MVLVLHAAVVTDEPALASQLLEALLRLGALEVEVLGGDGPPPGEHVELVLVGPDAAVPPSAAALVRVCRRGDRGDLAELLAAGVSAVVDEGATDEQLADLLIGALWAHRTFRQGAASVA